MKTFPNVILVGAMGAGKTFTGKELSHLLEFQFWDMDQWIEQQCKKKIKEIFQDEGEVFFRKKETEAVDFLKDKKHYVISTGGGVWVGEGNRVKLLNGGWCVWLKVSAKEIFKRVGPNLETRPLLTSSPKPLTTIEEILAQREPLYSLAHARVETDGRNPKDVALEIHRLLLEARPFDLS